MSARGAARLPVPTMYRVVGLRSCCYADTERRLRSTEQLSDSGAKSASGGDGNMGLQSRCSTTLNAVFKRGAHG